MALFLTILEWAARETQWSVSPEEAEAAYRRFLRFSGMNFGRGEEQAIAMVVGLAHGNRFLENPRGYQFSGITPNRQSTHRQ
jgi:hypothetical protein